MNHSFSCPHCQQPIDLETSFVHQVESQLAQKYNHHFADQASDLKRREEELRQHKLAIQKKEKEQREEVQKAVDIQLRVVQADALQKARTEQETTVQTLQAELRDKSETVKSRQQQELIFLRQQRELEEKQATLNLMVGAIGGIAEGVILSLPELEFAADEEAVVLE